MEASTGILPPSTTCKGQTARHLPYNFDSYGHPASCQEAMSLIKQQISMADPNGCRIPKIGLVNPELLIPI